MCTMQCMITHKVTFWCVVLSCSWHIYRLVCMVTYKTSIPVSGGGAKATTAFLSLDTVGDALISCKKKKNRSQACNVIIFTAIQVVFLFIIYIMLRQSKKQPLLLGSGYIKRVGGEIAHLLKLCLVDYEGLDWHWSWQAVYQIRWLLVIMWHV